MDETKNGTTESPTPTPERKFEHSPGRCAVGICGMVIPLAMLMCRGHWGKVPLSLQRVLWRAFKNAERSGGVLGDATYERAALDCVLAVERQVPEPLRGIGHGGPKLRPDVA
jgi:hypothetical protein